jgi:hypothetical protein
MVVGTTHQVTTAFTQRNITVGAVKVEETLCPKTLEAKWMQNPNYARFTNNDSI